MPSPYRREELIADRAGLVYLVSGGEGTEMATYVEIRLLIEKGPLYCTLVARRPSHGQFEHTRYCYQAFLRIFSEVTYIYKDSRKFYYVKNLYITKPFHHRRCMY
jgi:hypothetical protein